MSLNIEVSSSEVWTIITSKEHLKELDAVFVGSDVHFKYEPDKTVSTSKEGKLIENELIQVDNDFPGMGFVERYGIQQNGQYSILSVYAGVYGEDLKRRKLC